MFAKNVFGGLFIIIIISQEGILCHTFILKLRYPFGQHEVLFYSYIGTFISEDEKELTLQIHAIFLPKLNTHSEKDIREIKGNSAVPDTIHRDKTLANTELCLREQ
ncbi:hypothetical protein ACJX0J_031587 [Zea mays]